MSPAPRSRRADLSQVGPGASQSLVRRVSGALSRILKNPVQDDIRTSSAWGIWGNTSRATPDQSVLDQIEQIHPIVYRCCSVKSQDAAQLQPVLYLKKGKGEREIVDSHPMLDTMHWVNGLDTSYEWRQGVFLDTEIEGNHISWAPRGPIGWPTQLVRIDPKEVTPHPEPARVIDRYDRELGDGTIRAYDADDIWHFKVPNRKNRYWGYGAVHRLKDTVAIDQQMTRWRFNFFYNDLPVDILFRTSKGFSKDQMRAARTELNNALNGRENQGRRFAILDVDTWEVQVIPRPKGDEANYIEGRKFEHAVICCVMGVPPNKVMDFSESGGLSTNAEQQERLYWEDTIMSMHRMFAERMNKIMIRYVGLKVAQQYEWGFDYSTVKALNTSEKDKAETYGQLVDKAIVTRNQALAKLGLPKSGDPLADKLMYGNQLLGEKPEPLLLPPPDPKEDDPKPPKQIQLLPFHKDIDEVFDNAYEMALLQDRVYQQISAMMRRAGEMQVEFAGLTGAFNMADPLVLDILRRSTQYVLQAAVPRTNEYVRLAIARSRAESLPHNSAELRQLLQDAFDERRQKWQILRIARTEVHAVQEAASYAAALQAGIEHKQWITARDEKVRGGDETDDDANHRALEKMGPIPFASTWRDPKSGAELKYPGDREGQGVAGVDTINCRCSFVAYFPELAQLTIGAERMGFKQVSAPMPLEHVWEIKAAQRKRYETALAKIVAAHILGMQRRALARFDRLVQQGAIQ